MNSAHLGDFTIEGMSPGIRGAQAAEVTFRIDVDGILSGSATDKNTRQSLKVSRRVSDQRCDTAVLHALSIKEKNHMDSRHRIYRFSSIICLSLWIAIPCIACLHSSRIEAADATKTPIQLCQTSKAAAKEYLSKKGIQTNDMNADYDVANTYIPPDCSAPSWRANFPDARDYDEVKGQLTALCTKADGTLSEVRDPSHSLAQVSATCNLKSAANPTKTRIQACKDTADEAEKALEHAGDSYSASIDPPDSDHCLPLNWQLVMWSNYEEVGYTDADRKQVKEACTRAGGVLTHPDEENSESCVVSTPMGSEALNRTQNVTVLDVELDGKSSSDATTAGSPIPIILF